MDGWKHGVEYLRNCVFALPSLQPPPLAGSPLEGLRMRLGELLADEDLTEEKLLHASETLLPELYDALGRVPEPEENAGSPLATELAKHLKT